MLENVPVQKNWQLQYWDEKNRTEPPEGFRFFSSVLFQTSLSVDTWVGVSSWKGMCERKYSTRKWNSLETRHCTTVRNSDDQAIPLRWALTPICILSTTAASFDQQHQCISSISASAASLEKISAHIHQFRPHQSISINITRRAPDTTRHAPDTTRHHQTWSRHHQIPPHMHHVWFVWSKTSYSWDKVEMSLMRTAVRTNKQQRKIGLLSFWEPLSFAIFTWHLT